MTDPYEYQPELPDLSYLVEQIERVGQAQSEKAVVRWGVVTSLVPFEVTPDGETLPLAGTISSIADISSLSLGDRVLYVLQMQQATVLGAAGGAIPVPISTRYGLMGADFIGTTSERDDLKNSGLAVDGMRFYDTTDNREYVWSGSDWALAQIPREIIWSGNSRIGTGETLTFTKDAAQFPHGVILNWAVNGNGYWHQETWFSHEQIVQASPIAGSNVTVPVVTDSGVGIKNFIIDSSAIHDGLNNTSGVQGSISLIAVIGW